MIVAGSAVFKGDPKEAIALLRRYVLCGLHVSYDFFDENITQKHRQYLSMSGMMSVLIDLFYVVKCRGVEVYGNGKSNNELYPIP